MDVRTTAASQRADDIPTYYGHSAVKPSLYGWMVAIYIYISGLAAGLQVVVTAAELLSLPGNYWVALIGRAIALALIIVGALLLIADLHTKQRFFNMLRIFRPTSPMSFGTYLLLASGLWGLIAVIGQACGVILLGKVCGSLAAVTGWWLCTYTAALQSATATPLWAGSYKLLAMRYAAGAMSTGAAAACLVALGVAPGFSMALAFGNFAALALLVEFIASRGSARILKRIGAYGPLQEPPWGPVNIIGVQLFGLVIAFALFIAANFFATFALLLAGSILALVGGLLMRAVIMFTGNESAQRPRDYFRFARA
jgi:hypothetical protein